MTNRLTQQSGRSIFGGDVAGYHRVRVDYPEPLYEAIAARLGSQPIDAIGEIGPGTGIASAQLMRFCPRRLVGFEPDRALADYLETAMPAMDVVANDFVAAKIEGVFDLIAAAASFHWLEPDKAFAKIRRVLRPGGCVAMWWNVYREAGIGDDFAESVLPLLENVPLPPSEGAQGHYSFDWKLHLGRLVAAGFADPTFTIYRRQRVLTAQMARDLYASFSFVRSLDSGRREELLAAISRIVDSRFDGAAPTIILTPLYLASNPGDSGRQTGS